MPAKADQAKGVAFYALGGGMGHLVRASAIAGALDKLAGIRPVILTNCQFSQLFKSKSYKLIEIPTTQSPDDMRKAIIAGLDRLKPSALVVDALPMGLMGELREFLPAFPGKKILVARLLREDYREEMGVDDFVGSSYDAVIRCERMPDACLPHPHSVAVGPILAAGREDILTRTQARKALGAQKNEILILAVETAPPENADAFFALVADAVARASKACPWHTSSGAQTPQANDVQLLLRFASPYGDPSPSAEHTAFFPILKLLRGIDLIIGHAGYNLFHECAAAGVPAILHPRPRLYDDQQVRMKYAPRNVSSFHNAAQLEENLRRFLSSPKPPKSSVRHTLEGSNYSAKAIIELIVKVRR